ncbi:hypothetical protein DNR41_27490, partial [Escherichia coli]
WCRTPRGGGGFLKKKFFLNLPLIGGGQTGGVFFSHGGGETLLEKSLFSTGFWGVFKKGFFLCVDVSQ